MYPNYNNYSPYYNPNYNPNYNIQNTIPNQNNKLFDNQIGNQQMSNYQQPINTYQQPAQYLQGKQVESIDIVKSIEIPLDGSISYFPVADGSAIVTKQLQNNGTTKVSIFKQTDDNLNENKYATKEDIQELLNINQNNDYVTKESLAEMFENFDLEDIKNDIKEIKKQLKKKGE